MKINKKENIDENFSKLQIKDNNKENKDNKDQKDNKDNKDQKVNIKEKLKQIIFVDTFDAMEIEIKKLLASKYISVDIEGINLCRDGTISLIQISSCLNTYTPVIIFDITKLQKQAFQSGKYNLKSLLENKEITKLFWDVRMDCDALNHIYNVTPEKVLDVQIVFMKAFMNYYAKTNKFLVGLSKAIKILDLNSESEREVSEEIKLRGKSIFAPERGGDIKVWEQRPLLEDLLIYAAEDVKNLYKIFELSVKKINLEEAYEVSKERMLKIINEKTSLNQELGSQIDFIV